MGKLGRLAAIVAGTAMLLGGCRWNQARDTFSDDTIFHQPINEVRFDNSAGDVIVEVGTGRTTTVHRDVNYHDNAPGRTFILAKRTLFLESCGNRCAVGYRITVPAGTRVDGAVTVGTLQLRGVAAVDVESISGDVQISQVTGAVRVNSTDGSVHVDNAGAKVDVYTVSGSISVTGVAGDLNAQTQSGSVTARGLRGARTSARTVSGSVTVAADTSQHVDARTTSGNVTVTVPDDDYHVVTEVTHGRLDIGIPDDPNGSHLLRVRTTSGDISIHTP